MNTLKNPSILSLMLLISFASVNATLFTPAMPDIANYFAISSNVTQSTITWFLVGYTIGQLIYGPIANRFGRKPALYVGIFIQIISSLLCVLSGVLHEFSWLLVARFLVAIGSGVGLKMTFTILNECYEPHIVSKKISYLLLSFSVTPGLAVALGGLLTQYFGWMSCFYAGAIYGLIMLAIVFHLPETLQKKDMEALQLRHLFSAYIAQFKNIKLVAGGLLMGVCSSFTYIFAAAAPFIAIDHFAMSSSQYGFANLLPPIGLALGSVISAQLAQKFSILKKIFFGIIIIIIASVAMTVGFIYEIPSIFSLFFPMMFILFGLCFILGNASTLAMSHTDDKAHGSAVMNFMNMGLATVCVLSLGIFSMGLFLLPIFYFALCIMAAIIFVKFL